MSRGYRARFRGHEAGTIVEIIADVAAFILGLWILMYVLKANRANDLVSFVHDSANWLAGWSHDLFTMDTDWLRTLLNYGLPAVVYLVVGHAVARRIDRV